MKDCPTPGSTRLPFLEALIAADAAGLEAVHADLDTGLVLFDTTIDSFHQAGNIANLAATLSYVAGFFDRFDRPEIAATIYGTTTHHTVTVMVANLPALVDHLRTVLGDEQFDEGVATGAVMELADAVRYARAQIRLTQSELGRST